jgi:hypothetical protein
MWRGAEGAPVWKSFTPASQWRIMLPNGSSVVCWFFNVGVRTDTVQSENIFRLGLA